MNTQCPDCGSGEACPMCADAERGYRSRLADPHLSPGFLDGDLPCAVSGLWIKEHGPLVDGQSVCTREDA